MPRRFPLQTLLEHAQHRLEAAERLLRQRRRKEEMARQRLLELEGFRSEYQFRLSGGSQSGISIHMLRDFHIFLGKLEIAIKTQEEEVNRTVSAWQAAEQLWSEARKKVKAYETLADRHLKSEIHREDVLDQKQMDDLVTRRYAAERLKSGTG